MSGGGGRTWAARQQPAKPAGTCGGKALPQLQAAPGPLMLTDAAPCAHQPGLQAAHMPQATASAARRLRRWVAPAIAAGGALVLILHLMLGLHSSRRAAWLRGSTTGEGQAWAPRQTVAPRCTSPACVLSTA